VTVYLEIVKNLEKLHSGDNVGNFRKGKYTEKSWKCQKADYVSDDSVLLTLVLQLDQCCDRCLLAVLMSPLLTCVFESLQFLCLSVCLSVCPALPWPSL